MTTLISSNSPPNQPIHFRCHTPDLILTPTDELDDIAQSKDLDFDLDIFKIVKKALFGSHKSNVVKLSTTDRASPLF